jgi:hypothetical protein
MTWSDMGEPSPWEGLGRAGRVSDGAMHTAGPDCVALRLSFVVDPENESETERALRDAKTGIKDRYERYVKTGRIWYMPGYAGACAK